MDVKNGNWWLETSMRKRDKFNIVHVWLKTESINRAKVQGSDYNYTVILMSFSCSDATYHTESFTDVFYSASNPDDSILIKEMFDKKFSKVKNTDEDSYIYESYKKVC